MEKVIIDAMDAVAGNPEYRMAGPINLRIGEGQHICIVGDNAAGKTRLVETLCGNIPVKGDAIRYDFSPSPFRLVSENIRYIAFRDTYEGADPNYYHQKRWNQVDIDEDTLTAGQVLDRAYSRASDEYKARLLEMFGLGSLLDKYIITLSSGELRKFQITRMLLTMPRVLVLDNPFIGLDAPTRDLLSELLGELVRSLDITVILVMSRLDIIPDFITHIIPVEGLRVLPQVTVAQYLAERGRTDADSPVLSDGTLRLIEDLPVKDLTAGHFYPQGTAPEIVKCNKVSIRYGQRTILKDLDWTVREGEKWALGGENGAGKSTLLSLVCADNPQSYACNIELFGHKRGSGESIWDIKRHIGYVSPEMHRSYLKNITALDVVASGLFDTVGLFMHPTESQLATCRTWMSVFGIEALAEKSYLKISSGEQRLCLLARAFVKDPELLILDEPLHGLDARRSRIAKEVIGTFVRRPHKTLIMVSHYQSEFPDCIDRSLYLHRQA